MKYGLIAIVVAFLGIGEYVFVEYYPITHNRRIQKFEKLPIVRSIIKANNTRAVQKMIEESDSEFVSIVRNNTIKRWYDAQSWSVEYEAGDTHARGIYYRVHNLKEFQKHFGVARKQAEAGDLQAMFAMYLVAKSIPDKGVMEEALELLENEGSATADFYLNSIIKSIDPQSRESLLIIARMTKENHRPSSMNDHLFERQTERHQKGMDWFRESAENGDANAIWVLEQLEAEEIELP